MIKIKITTSCFYCNRHVINPFNMRLTKWIDMATKITELNLAHRDCVAEYKSEIEKENAEFAPWVSDWEASQESVQYWKEHSKRNLTQQDLENFFGEEV